MPSGKRVMCSNNFQSSTIDLFRASTEKKTPRQEIFIKKVYFHFMTFTIIVVVMYVTLFCADFPNKIKLILFVHIYREFIIDVIMSENAFSDYFLYFHCWWRLNC